MSKKYTAQCACGAVKFEFDKDPEFVANCHCLDCKRASGGEMATFFAIAEDDFTLLSGSPKAFPYVANSGKKLERNFCPDCGSRLYTSELESFPGLVFVQLGSLDHPELIAPRLEMFTVRRLKWNRPLDLPQFEGMPH
ncbi:GFA family protein [Rhizobium sp. NPDC090279]|uniref:GFA family protein n=1 Tax=Rhizobium sp. NPDC090279 TaxID=3364499 RepID=UPI003839E995